jgi:hypothetical protein
MDPIHDGEAGELETLDRVWVSTNGGQNVAAIYVEAIADIGRMSTVVKRDGWMVRWLKRRVDYLLGGQDRLVGKQWLAQELTTDPFV